MLDYIERRNRAKSKSRRFVAYMIVAVLGVVAFQHACVSLLGVYFLRIVYRDTVPFETMYCELFCDQWFASIDCAVLTTIILVAGFIKIRGLRRLGADGVARRLGGEHIDGKSNSPREKRLFDVAQEIAIAAGIPAPRVYALNDEPSINACAIGFDENDAIVCVTRGALDWLERDELQGVVAHEIGHIVNGDVGFNLRLIAILYGLDIWRFSARCGKSERIRREEIARLDRETLKLRRRAEIEEGFFHRMKLRRLASECEYKASKIKRKNVNDDNMAFLIGVMSSGSFFAGWLRALAQRQRERLADAVATELTRNPLGLANALKKVGSLQFSSRMETGDAYVASHLFFGPTTDRAKKRFSLHPSLRKRISALDPTFDGTFPRGFKPVDWEARGEAKEKDVTLARFANGFLAFERSVVREIPRELTEKLDALATAKATACAAIWSNGLGDRDVGAEALKRFEDKTVVDEFLRVFGMVAALPPCARFTLLPRVFEQFRSSKGAPGRVETLFANSLNGWVNAVPGAFKDPFFVKLTLLGATDALVDRKSCKNENVLLESVVNEFKIALAFLAFAGERKRGQGAARDAYEKALAFVEAEPDVLGVMPTRATLSEDAAFNAIKFLRDNVSEELKIEIMSAFYACVERDGAALENEANLLNAYAWALGADVIYWKDHLTKVSTP